MHPLLGRLQLFLKSQSRTFNVRKMQGAYNSPVNIEGMTHPGYEPGKECDTLRYGIHESPFGKYLLAVTAQNRIVRLDFEENEQAALEKLQLQWSRSNLIHRPGMTSEIALRIFARPGPGPLRLLVMGTPFQLKVWQCLLNIQFGETRTYQWVAEQVETPGGFQAVGNAIGKNPIAFLVPCHRVTRKNGQISNYRWGTPRKVALLAWEKNQAISSSAVRVRSI
jgi:AraC family transcriptional regulator of adaptative response/methylated-DNA-[protein]-cysteine methyltransferase